MCKWTISTWVNQSFNHLSLEIFPGIFPSGSANHDLYLSAWEGYLTREPFGELVLRLAGYYERALKIDPARYTKRSGACPNICGQLCCCASSGRMSGRAPISTRCRASLSQCFLLRWRHPPQAGIWLQRILSRRLRGERRSTPRFTPGPQSP